MHAVLLVEGSPIPQEVLEDLLHLHEEAGVGGTASERKYSSWQPLRS